MTDTTTPDAAILTLPVRPVRAASLSAPLSGRGDGPGAAPGSDSDLFLLVDRYWQSCRRGRIAPLRSDIDPRGLAPALPYVLIAERLAPGIARLRIAGSELNDLLGMEARGMPMTVFAEPEARRVLSSAVEEVCAAPGVLDMRLSSAASYGRPALTGRLMLWPLLSETGAVDRLLGCLVPLGETGRAPRRFLIGTPRVYALEPGLPATTPDPAPNPARGPRAIPGYAEDAAAYVAQPGNQPGAIRTRGHLRLVKSDV